MRGSSPTLVSKAMIGICRLWRVIYQLKSQSPRVPGGSGLHSLSTPYRGEDTHLVTISQYTALIARQSVDKHELDLVSRQIHLLDELADSRAFRQVHTDGLAKSHSRPVSAQCGVEPCVHSDHCGLVLPP